MIKLLVWARKKEEMSPEEFRAYWTGPHAALARRTYPHAARYVVNLVSRAPRGETALFDGLAELVWNSKEDFDADIRKPEARAVADDLATFVSTSGTLYADEHSVVP